MPVTGFQAFRLQIWLLFFACLFPLAGCVRNRIYHPQPDSVVTVPPLAPVAPDARKARAKRIQDEPCNPAQIVETPCLAYLEFDDMGEPWERNPSGRPAQLSRALDLIRDARERDPNTLVLVFIHGWRHNAAGGGKVPEDTNVTGFKAVLQGIHQDYPHPILGVYVGWRGEIVSRRWPVVRQFSYFNREAAAMRVSSRSLTEALVELSAAVQSRLPGDSKPSAARIVMIGHSFGGLVLERAISQAMIISLEMQFEAWQNSTPAQESAAEKAMIARKCGYPDAVIEQPLANLIIFLNSAAGANESKQLMDYLAGSHFTYQNAQGPQPLILSVTSKTDIATGIIFRIGHGANWLGYRAAGSMRPRGPGPANPADASADYSRACYDSMIDPKKERLFDMSQTSFYMTTTAHSPQLQSHTVEEIVQHGAYDPNVMECTPQTLPPRNANTASSNQKRTAVSCTMGQYIFNVNEINDRCNGTPYWAMEVPSELIRDHDSIFTARLITFLSTFVSTNALSPERAPSLCRPAAEIE
jgi:hypothetical protein